MNPENRGCDLRVSVPVCNNRQTLVGIGDSRAEVRGRRVYQSACKGRSERRVNARSRGREKSVCAFEREREECMRVQEGGRRVYARSRGRGMSVCAFKREREECMRVQEGEGRVYARSTFCYVARKLCADAQQAEEAVFIFQRSQNFQKGGTYSCRNERGGAAAARKREFLHSWCERGCGT